MRLFYCFYFVCITFCRYSTFKCESLKNAPLKSLTTAQEITAREPKKATFEHFTDVYGSKMKLICNLLVSG